jgi:hypothetical protein
MRFHTKVSLVKSLFRILAGTSLIVATIKTLVVAGVFLVIAELLGIAEEIDS